MSGGPFQLVEVSSKAVKEGTKSVSNSQPGTPFMKAQRSPEVQPAGVPAEIQEWSIDAGGPKDVQPEASPGPAHRSANHGNGRWGDEPDEADADGFNAQYLIGEWNDNLGHSIFVTPDEMGGRGQRDRRRRGNKGGGKGGGKPGFLVVMQKFGMPEKRFNINKDRRTKEWTCGNGSLVRDDSSMEKIVWKAPDGRCSTWERTPPEGPVFFDAPPMQEGDGQQPPWWNGSSMQGDGAIYFDGPEAWSGPPSGPWKGPNLPADGAPRATGEPATGEVAAAADGGTATLRWNTAAPEFVMPAFAPSAVSATPELGPASAPSTPSVMLRPQAAATSTPSLSPAVPPGPTGAQALACQLKLSEESPDVLVSGNRLEWSVPDDWGKLKRFPKDFCITSPMFGTQQAASMQLVFYPNGSRTAEAGRCTVALTRGPDSKGIKFEFSVNERGSGPKVCLGRRYLGDYPKPYDDSEETKDEKVKVCLQVLEVLGI